MNKNPKGLYGINIPEKTYMWQEETPTVTIYHICANCSNKWQTEIKAWVIANNMTTRKYDYCSECYKNS